MGHSPSASDPALRDGSMQDSVPGWEGATALLHSWAHVVVLSFLRPLHLLCLGCKVFPLKEERKGLKCFWFILMRYRLTGKKRSLKALRERKHCFLPGLASSPYRMKVAFMLYYIWKQHTDKKSVPLPRQKCAGFSHVDFSSYGRSKAT